MRKFELVWIICSNRCNNEIKPVLKSIEMRCIEIDGNSADEIQQKQEAWMLRVKHLHCKSTVVIARPSTVWDLSTHILNMYMKIVIMLQTNYDDINYGPEQRKKKQMKK